ncbi:MAG: tetratricopeptide repeat protein [Burkholderiales bacterium]
MELSRIRIPKSLGLAVLSLALLAAGAARADEYADVNQLMRSGKLPEALNKADQYLAGKPKDPQMRFIKGVVLTEAGRTADAIATFQKLTEDYPELPEPYNNLAVLYAGQGQFDKARAALEMAIRTNPSYATAHENLGDVYAKLASQAYTRALQLDATNTQVQPKLALIRELFSVGTRTSAAAPAARATTVAAAPAAAPAGKPAPAPAAAPAPRAAPAAAPVAAAPAPAAAHPAPAPAPAVAAAAASSAASTPAATAAGPAAGTREVEAAVHAWANAWSSKDMNTYLASYGKEFDPPGKQSRAAWEAERRSRIVGKKQISVQLGDLKVAVTGNKAVAHFHQNYSADGLKVSSHKRLDLVKNGEHWTIVRESTGA